VNSLLYSSTSLKHIPELCLQRTCGRHYSAILSHALPNLKSKVFSSSSTICTHMWRWSITEAMIQTSCNVSQLLFVGSSTTIMDSYNLQSLDFVCRRRQGVWRTCLITSILRPCSCYRRYSYSSIKRKAVFVILRCLLCEPFLT
jgi:hypothetical protein